MSHSSKEKPPLPRPSKNKEAAGQFHTTQAEWTAFKDEVSTIQADLASVKKDAAERFYISHAEWTTLKSEVSTLQKELASVKKQKLRDTDCLLRVFSDAIPNFSEAKALQDELHFLHEAILQWRNDYFAAYTVHQIAWRNLVIGLDNTRDWMSRLNPQLYEFHPRPKYTHGLDYMKPSLDAALLRMSTIDDVRVALRESGQEALLLDRPSLGPGNSPTVHSIKPPGSKPTGSLGNQDLIRDAESIYTAMKATHTQHIEHMKSSKLLSTFQDSETSNDSAVQDADEKALDPENSGLGGQDHLSISEDARHTLSVEVLSTDGEPEPPTKSTKVTAGDALDSTATGPQISQSGTTSRKKRILPKLS